MESNSRSHSLTKKRDIKGPKQVPVHCIWHTKMNNGYSYWHSTQKGFHQTSTFFPEGHGGAGKISGGPSYIHDAFSLTLYVIASDKKNVQTNLHLKTNHDSHVFGTGQLHNERIHRKVKLLFNHICEPHETHPHFQVDRKAHISQFHIDRSTTPVSVWQMLPNARPQ